MARLWLIGMGLALMRLAAGDGAPLTADVVSVTADTTLHTADAG